MHIPSWPQAGDREEELLRSVLASPQWGGFHPFVEQFETDFADYQHSRFGISAFNGTVTLELALEILEIGPGDEVIVPAISFISTATAVARVGAVPVFVDIERDSFNIDPAAVRRALSPQTKAVIAVHFGGTMCEIDAITAICQERGIVLLEDAAHAQGSEWRGKRAGSFGVAGSFSFQNGKVLCAGEGGMLVTSDAAFAEAARSVANCGRRMGKSFYEHDRLGTNFRLTAFQAAVLIAQFERLPQQTRHRTGNARLLHSLLCDVPEISWQQQPSAVTANSWYLMIGRVSNGLARTDLGNALTAARVPFTLFYPHTLYQNRLFEDVTCRVLPCPVAEAAVQDAFWLPHRVLLSDEETIGEIAAVVREACTHANEVAAATSRRS